MFKHIMVPLDGSDLAECVLPQVVSIATGCGVPLVSLVRVVPPFKIYASELEGTFAIPEMQKIEDESVSNARLYLEKKASEMTKQGVKPQVSVLFGNVIDSLAEFVEKNKVDLIIIATHGRSGISRFVWGSIADRILRTAKVAVLMIRPEACQLPQDA
jgi:nucleotide-binding universal stress UspA family protein